MSSSVPVAKFGHGLRVLKNNAQSASDVSLVVQNDANNNNVQINAKLPLQITWQEEVDIGGGVMSTETRTLFDASNLAANFKDGTSESNIFLSLNKLVDLVDNQNTLLTNLQSQVASLEQSLNTLTNNGGGSNGNAFGNT